MNLPKKGDKAFMSVVKKELIKNLEDLLRFQFSVQQEQKWDEYDLLEQKIEKAEKEILDPQDQER